MSATDDRSPARARPGLSREKALWKQGVKLVAGVDEAGRGPLAGPVQAAAVVLPRGYSHRGLHDSKKLSAPVREEIFEELTRDERVVWCSAFASVEEVDRFNILNATHLAMRRAVEGLSSRPDHVLVDGLPVRGMPVPHTAIVKGDSLSLSISAASVIAKVIRDRWMREAAQAYPGFGFETHMGYGTPFHLEMLQKHGPTPIHRRSFAPVAQLTLDLGI